MLLRFAINFQRWQNSLSIRKKTWETKARKTKLAVQE